MPRSHSFLLLEFCLKRFRFGPPGGEDGGEFLVGGPMRARTERNHLREPMLWLAAAVWLWAGQGAWAQAPGSPASGADNGSLGLKAGEDIPSERIQEIYRRILKDWSAGETERAPNELIELETSVVVEGDLGTRK